MSDATALAEERRRLRALLAQQRAALALRIGTDGGSHDVYPRSVTMRWLIREPALLTTLVRWIAGPRAAAAAPAMLALGRLWRAAAEERRASAAPALPEPETK